MSEILHPNSVVDEAKRLKYEKIAKSQFDVRLRQVKSFAKANQHIVSEQNDTWTGGAEFEYAQFLWFTHLSGKLLFPDAKGIITWECELSGGGVAIAHSLGVAVMSVHPSELVGYARCDVAIGALEEGVMAITWSRGDKYLGTYAGEVTGIGGGGGSGSGHFTL